MEALLVENLPIVSSGSPMLRAPSASGSPLPNWLVAAWSVAILLHLVAIIIPILDTPSGPWVTPTGHAMAEPPEFAHAASGLATLHGKYFRVAHSYHFVSNRPADLPGVQFEVLLRDADGNLLNTLRFPDPNANPWVRHRQEVLASALAPDISVAPPGGEVIAAPGATVPTVAIWTLPDDLFPGGLGGNPAPAPTDRTVHLRLRTTPQHLIPRTRGVMRPTDWSLILARSYARYLCRAYGAQTAEIVRHTREPVSPGVLFGNETSAQAFEDLVATFGEMPRFEEKSR
jgi:hypothetical protein